jgi:ATPase subunit of ABC transporter with duplicated ATPase domains
MQQFGGTLAAHDISVHRGADAILERVSLTVTSGSRIGVVGPNGRGKTTLLRALAGFEELDSGSVRRNPPSLRVGYLPQERDVLAGERLLAYLQRRTGEASTVEFEGRAAAALRRVGLDVELERCVAELSGGERSRAALASILLARFDAYLLDEPTNDLDFDGLELLERFLLRLDAGFVVVSHDRAFLDRTVNRIVELSAKPKVSGAQRREPESSWHGVDVYTGGWSEYEAARERARSEHERAYTQWSEERARFGDLHRERREQARVGGKQASRRGTQALMSKTRAAARRVEWLERDRVEKPWQPWELRLDLAPAGRSGDLVVALEDAVVERGAFRLGPLDFGVQWGERLSIAGPNGSGKTTLIDALLGRLPLVSGERRVGPAVVFGEIGQERSLFASDEPLIRSFCAGSSLREGDARTLLAKFDLYADHVLRPAGRLSPGERTRAELALQAARRAGCLVLDEPTNHLDLPAVEELERALGAFDGTLILVTHDRRFLERVGVTCVYALSSAEPDRDPPTARRRPRARR